MLLMVWQLWTPTDEGSAERLSCGDSQRKTPFMRLTAPSRCHQRFVRPCLADDLIAYGAYKDQLWKIELLRAIIKFRQRNITGALRRIRSAKTIYEDLELPAAEFIRHTVNRLKLGSGLFKVKRK